MTYQMINPPFYEMYQPDSPYHAGAPGWTRAPFPGWGNNPVMRGPKRLAMQGLGSYYPTQYNWAINGLGSHDLPMESLQPHYAVLPGATGGLGCPGGCGGGRGVGQNGEKSETLMLVIGLGVTATLMTLGYFALRPQHARNRGRRRYRTNGRRRHRRNATWSSAYKGDLPDSAFLYVDQSCVTEKQDGRSHPLSCRKFPYKNHLGRVDLPHVRNAISRIPQSNLSAQKKTKLQKKARAILARAEA